MFNLLYKELCLAAHPNLYIFMCMGALLLVPNYPLGVVFLFGMLGPYITVFYDRETRDTYFTVLLPIKKGDVVTGKCLLIVFAQIGELIISVPFALLRTVLYDGNSAGIEANVAYYGFGLLIFALYDFLFIINYYKTAYRVGLAFIIAAIPAVTCIAAMEIVTFIPYAAWLDSTAPEHLISQLPILAAGCILYPIGIAAACRMGQKNFEHVDIQ